MSRVRNASVSFFLFLVLFCASMGIASPRTASARQVRSVQESAVVGGSDGCAFSAGLAVGLDLAGLAGCVPCAFGGALIGLGTLIACS